MKTFKKLFSVSAIVALLGTLAPFYAFGATYSDELQEAYEYAYAKNVTTMTSIDNANMYGSLTRIAMAKMIANYATTVLNLEEVDNAGECTFSDVTASLDAQYDNGVTNACKLGLMGQNITAFRPNDPVTRGEFGTTLSRALNRANGNTIEEGTPYYENHLAFLKSEGIMNDISNPSATEVRGYVMLMMMRADDGYVAPADSGKCTLTERVDCILNADDTEACIAACSDQEPEEEPEYTDNKSGTLTAKISSESPDADTVVPANVERVPFLVFTVNADEDITLYSATFEFEGYGNTANITNFAIYDSNNVKVSKGTPTMKQGKVTVNFASNVVVKSSETYTVVAKIPAGDNSTYGLSLTAINSSAESIKGLPVAGAAMKNISVTNNGVLTYVAYNGVDTDITVGKEATIATFKLSNETKVEDIEIESITIDMDSTKGEWTNLALYADDDVIADNLTINNKQIVANVDYTLPKNTKNVKFELKATATEIVTSAMTLSLDVDAISAKGEKYGFTTAVSGLTTKQNIGTVTKVSGSDISVSFSKGDVDEVVAGAQGVYLGKLTLTAQGNYTINQLFVTVGTPNNTGIIEDLRLGGVSYDNYSASGYKFTDIALNAGTKVELPLVVDVDEDAANGSGVELILNFTDASFEDTDNDVTYTATLNTIVSTMTPLDGKAITVLKPTVTLATKSLTNRTGALGGQDYILAYKARVDTNDAGDVTINRIIFENKGVINHGTETGETLLAAVVDSAELELNGETYTTSNISADKITFTKMGAELPAGLSNKDLKLSIKLKSTTDYTGAITLSVNDITLKDTDKTTFVKDALSSSTISIASAGVLTVAADKTETTTTEMKDFTKTAKLALAGAEESVLLGKVKLTADVENFKISKLVLDGTDTAIANGKFESSIKDVILLIDGEEVVSTAKTTSAGGTTTITFDNIKNVKVTTATPVYAEVRATFNEINEKSAEGGATAGAQLSAINVVVTAEGEADSNGKFNTTPVAIDPAATVTVAANTIADVVITPANSLEPGTDVKVGTLTITPTAQNWNIDANGDVINEFLSGYTLTGTASALSGSVPTLKLQRLGTGLDGANDASKIEGATTFDIIASSITFDSSNRTPSLTIKLEDVTTGLVFTSGIKRYLPQGADKTLSVTVK